jgi:hypothetical protein
MGHKANKQRALGIEEKQPPEQRGIAQRPD